MNDLNDFVERYVAVWNEPDSERRRQRIAALWTLSGASLHRVLEPRGHAAIEARVAASYDKWVHGRGCTFRSARHAFGHHDAVMCNWEMVSPEGKVISLGLSFLILDPHGLVHTELQFSEPPPAPLPEHETLVEQVVAMWNEPDPQARRHRIAELWQAAGAHVNSERTCVGHAAIEAEAARVYTMCGAHGQRFRCPGRVDGHHDAVRMDWELLADDGVSVLAAGTNLLLLGADGRVQRDLQFDTPAKRMAS
jgi:hypothetical protein